ncbi:MAG: SDR family oxidoreductase [Chloroflexota bacterium]
MSTFLPSRVRATNGFSILLATLADGAVGAANKAGLLAFTKVVAHEVAEHGITMNAIAPGLIYNKLPGCIYPKEYFEDVLGKPPVKRFGKPEDIASAILFLVSDEASFITGETICVSGGLHMR